MNFLKPVILFFFLFLLTSFHSFSQTGILDMNDLSGVNVDNYSDKEITDMYTRTRTMNLSRYQLERMLKEKGMTETEIFKLNQRIQKLGLESSNQINQPAKMETTETGRTYSEEKYNIPMSENIVDLSVFGAELFTKNSLVFEPNIRIPTPASYVLGPDDEIVVNVFGNSEMKYNLTLNPEGNIYIPNVGPLFINGLTIEEATSRIKAKLASTIYKAISTGQTKVQVSLGNIRSIRVTVIGQARKPGTYTVSSLTTLYNILYLCGGPNEKGSYREIEIVRGNDVKKTADLYNFLHEGSQKDNVLLREGDVVRIPYFNTRVNIEGNVKRNGKYEMKKGESVNDLLDFSGGFDDIAYRSALTITRITDTGKTVIDIPESKFGSFVLQPGDEVFINRNQQKFANLVIIRGAVNRPGYYELTNDLTIRDLLNNAGGLLEEAYTERATIFRFEKNRLPSAEAVNLDSVTSGLRNMSLKNNDSIYVHSITEFTENYSIKVDGNIRKPGEIKWRKNLTLQDAILACGGINEKSDSVIVEVSRKIKNATSSNGKSEETKIFTCNFNQEKQSTEDIILEPFDLIIVKGTQGLSKQRTVWVMGEVKIPGRYALETSADKITDLLKRANGFRTSADSSIITIRRINKSNMTVEERENIFKRLFDASKDSLEQDENFKNTIYKNYNLISVDIKKIFTDNSSKENLVLEDGDILTVDNNSNLIRISGEIYYPTIIPFKEGNNTKYYVRKAGNYLPTARKNGTIVIYPNGQAKQVKKFLFFKSYPEVIARSEVFVPSKNKNNKNKLTAGELALIVSSLAIVANVLITALKP